MDGRPSLAAKSVIDGQLDQPGRNERAAQRIKLDLDDGAKVNYGKFGDVLAEVKAVTGKKATD